MNVSYAVSQPASFSILAIFRVVTTVSDKVSFYINFNVPFPIQSGVQLIVTFPSTYPIIVSPSQKYASIQNQLFSSTYLAFTPTSTQMLIIGNNGNLNASLDQQIEFTQINNPPMVKSTDSFTITLKDSNNGNIATSTTQYIDASAITPGAISGSITFNTSVVQQTSSINFTFTPTHDLIVNATYAPRLIVTLPSTITMPSTCTLTSIQTISATTACSFSG